MCYMETVTHRELDGLIARGEARPAHTAGVRVIAPV